MRDNAYYDLLKKEVEQGLYAHRPQPNSYKRYRWRPVLIPQTRSVRRQTTILRDQLNSPSRKECFAAVKNDLRYGVPDDCRPAVCIPLSIAISNDQSIMFNSCGKPWSVPLSLRIRTLSFIETFFYGCSLIKCPPSFTRFLLSGEICDQVQFFISSPSSSFLITYSRR